MNKTLVNINGEMTSAQKAKVSVFDHGFLFGDSVYEVTCTHQKKPLMLTEHIDRLYHSAEKIGLVFDFDRSFLMKQIEITLDRLFQDFDVSRAYIRVIVTRGEGAVNIDPTQVDQNNLIIIAKELAENPSWWYQQGVHMIVAKVLRNPRESIDPNIKSGNYLNNVLAMAEARKQGVFDAIMLNKAGQVTEGTTSNIWIVKSNELITPPLQAGILAGITRQKLLQLGPQSGLKVVERNFNEAELKDADECFLTSTTKDLVPIIKIDDKTIGKGRPGEWTLKLLNIYRDSLV